MLSVYSDLKVAVVSVCVACAAYVSDGLTLLYFIAYVNAAAGHMSVKCGDLVAVVDNNVDTVAVACVGSSDDRSRCSCNDRLASAAGLCDVDALMEIAGAALFINGSVAIAVCHVKDSRAGPDKALRSTGSVVLAAVVIRA